jgi:hypothetical protein
MTRVTLLALAGLAPAVPCVAQHAWLGPELAVADYREVSSSLRYSGVGPGVAARVTAGRFTLDGALLSIRMRPSGGSGATESFRATEIDGRLRWEANRFVGFEAGITRRSASSEFVAQSVGAVRLGARTQYALGPGAVVWARGDYLAAARFSGGGTAPFAVELGLGVDVALSRHVHVAVDYALQEFARTTHPGGGDGVSAPIEQARARLGVAAGF